MMTVPNDTEIQTLLTLALGIALTEGLDADTALAEARRRQARQHADPDRQRLEAALAAMGYEIRAVDVNGTVVQCIRRKDSVDVYHP